MSAIAYSPQCPPRPLQAIEWIVVLIRLAVFKEENQSIKAEHGDINDRYGDAVAEESSREDERGCESVGKMEASVVIVRG